MMNEIQEKQEKIDLFHEKLKELNKIDEPSFFNEIFQNKKLEEHEEVIEAIDLTKKAIQHLRSELIDKVILTGINARMMLEWNLQRLY